MSKCYYCNGTGIVSGTDMDHHPGCDGSCEFCPIPIEVPVPCGNCHGTGNELVNEEPDDQQ
jgi:DnaJ-class molecular chaperone